MWTIPTCVTRCISLPLTDLHSLFRPAWVLDGIFYGIFQSNSTFSTLLSVNMVAIIQAVCILTIDQDEWKHIHVWDQVGQCIGEMWWQTSPEWTMYMYSHNWPRRMKAAAEQWGNIRCIILPLRDIYLGLRLPRLTSKYLNLCRVFIPRLSRNFREFEHMAVSEQWGQISWIIWPLTDLYLGLRRACLPYISLLPVNINVSDQVRQFLAEMWWVFHGIFFGIFPG